ncbi:unnamed protein product [Brachionus calyciflorus]|uniref:Uncharacterized protein n=1 Tax=Brachionus calyciflorus TaxID=104777 RepID=A0A814JDL2_9BILA|nr:unnamed protein product [Brachionus calyciflorus]
MPLNPPTAVANKNENLSNLAGSSNFSLKATIKAEVATDKPIVFEISILNTILYNFQTSPIEMRDDEETVVSEFDENAMKSLQCS